MSIHPGDANQRLASEVDKLILLRGSPVSDKFKAEFDELQDLIDKALLSLKELGLYPSKFHSIQSRTAAKYILLLLQIEEHWTNLDWNREI
jgi:hypothetical protein